MYGTTTHSWHSSIRNLLGRELLFYYSIMPSSLLRFLASGAANTLVSYVLYLLLLRFMPYQWAYSLAYAAGIVLAYVLYRYYVFKASGGKLGPMMVVMIYFLQYCLGLGLVLIWGQWLGLPVVFAPVFAIFLSSPVTYVLSRRVFRHREKK